MDTVNERFIHKVWTAFNYCGSVEVQSGNPEGEWGGL